MNLTEILAEIDEKYPNALSNDSKVRKINNIQNKLFRTVVKRTITTGINLIKDLSIYSIDFSPTKIREVLVDGLKYEYRQLESVAGSRFYYILDGDLGIYPTPTADLENGILIYHYQEPAQLSASDLIVIPDLDEDFHSLLVYGTCKELAEADQRYDLANGFMQQYEAELGLFEEANQDTEPAQIQEEVWW